MTNKCCGKDCVTKYCPHCGGFVNTHPLEGLLRHLKTTARTYLRRIEKYEEYSRDEKHSEDQPESMSGYMARMKKQFDKWNAWYGVLKEMIEEDERELPNGKDQFN